MNWNELNAEIGRMTPQQRLQEVRFVEPYDKQRAGYYLQVVFPREDLTIDGESDPSDDSDVVFVRKGEPCLL